MHLEEIKSKFSWATDIASDWEEIADYLKGAGSEVPKIVIDLDNAESRYNWGDSSYVLDMTWYARYKPTIDLIIIGFTYIGFFFLLYKRLPDIIKGAGAITSIELQVKNDETSKSIHNGDKREW